MSPLQPAALTRCHISTLFRSLTWIFTYYFLSLIYSITAIFRIKGSCSISWDITPQLILDGSFFTNSWFIWNHFVLYGSITLLLVPMTPFISFWSFIILFSHYESFWLIIVLLGSMILLLVTMTHLSHHYSSLTTYDSTDYRWLHLLPFDSSTFYLVTMIHSDSFWLIHQSFSLY